MLFFVHVHDCRFFPTLHLGVLAATFFVVGLFISTAWAISVVFGVFLLVVTLLFAATISHVDLLVFTDFFFSIFSSLLSSRSLLHFFGELLALLIGLGFLDVGLSFLLSRYFFLFSHFSAGLFEFYFKVFERRLIRFGGWSKLVIKDLLGL